MKLHQVVEVSEEVTRASGRKDKIQRLAGLLRSASATEVELVVRWLSGELRQGRVGVGFAQLQQLSVPPASGPSLEVVDVDRVFDELKTTAGVGSVERRKALLVSLFERAAVGEQHFLLHLLVGELRQGALEGVMVEAVAAAARVPAGDLRRAAMLSGDLATVAVAAFQEGAAALGRFGVELFRPLQPMLADSADDLETALGWIDDPLIELKIDGARIQVHRRGDEVKVYTRSLKDVTHAVPEVVERVRALSAQEVVLDGEVLALRPDGRPHPFQTTMRRFGRKTSGGELGGLSLRDQLPLTPFFFDCLVWGGETVLDQPLRTRLEMLEREAPSLVIPRVAATTREAAQSFFDRATADGHEGVMVKDLKAPYSAGARGSAWLKVKPTITLDLVVLAAEWGSGRRKGTLSNLHLGARDPKGGWVMLGKTFKGLTDAMLAWQTAHLLAIAVDRGDWVVTVRPELVVEIAFNEIQESPRYPGGLALRFARVKAHRPDKSPEQADTIDTVRAIFDRSRA